MESEDNKIVRGVIYGSCVTFIFHFWNLKIFFQNGRTINKIFIKQSLGTSSQKFPYPGLSITDNGAQIILPHENLEETSSFN